MVSSKNPRLSNWKKIWNESSDLFFCIYFTSEVPQRTESRLLNLRFRLLLIYFICFTFQLEFFLIMKSSNYNGKVKSKKEGHKYVFLYKIILPLISLYQRKWCLWNFPNWRRKSFVILFFARIRFAVMKIFSTCFLHGNFN